MLHLRGLDTVRITKVTGHADEGMVLDGGVPELDRLGNEAADFGRRRVSNALLTRIAICLGFVVAGTLLFLTFIGFFFIAISRAVVHHDGRDGTAPDHMVLSAGALSKRRRLVHAVRDRAFLPRPPGIWDSQWVTVLASAICAEDVAHWPFSTGLLVKWVAFFTLTALAWLDLGMVAFVKLNCSFLKNFGLVRGCPLKKRFLLILGQSVQIQCRLFHLVQALIFGAFVVSLG